MCTHREGAGQCRGILHGECVVHHHWEIHAQKSGCHGHSGCVGVVRVETESVVISGLFGGDVCVTVNIYNTTERQPGLGSTAQIMQTFKSVGVGVKVDGTGRCGERGRAVRFRTDGNLHDGTGKVGVRSNRDVRGEEDIALDG